MTHLSLTSYLKNFFQLENVFDVCKDFMLKQQNEVELCNIVQTDLWKKKSKPDKITFPLTLYFDEIEVGNALGSHSGVHKLGMVYASLPILPNKYRSKLENIFPCLLFHSGDLKNIDRDIIFDRLIKELNNFKKYLSYIQNYINKKSKFVVEKLKKIYMHKLQKVLLIRLQHVCRLTLKI